MKRDLDAIMYEALVVGLIGVCVALTANHFYPRGVKLTRNYFPEDELTGAALETTDAATRPRVTNEIEMPAGASAATSDSRLTGPGEVQAGPSGPAQIGESMPPALGDSAGVEPKTEIRKPADQGRENLEARLKAKRLVAVDLEEAEALFRDPRYELEEVIFVDARNQRLYGEGHVPGAYHLDHFYPEDTLEEVLPAARAAEVVVVYCEGGECEDSEFTALFLRQAGVPQEQLRVFVGGMTQWSEQGLPIELGQRRSGVSP